MKTNNRNFIIYILHKILRMVKSQTASMAAIRNALIGSLKGKDHLENLRVGEDSINDNLSGIKKSPQ